MCVHTRPILYADCKGRFTLPISLVQVLSPQKSRQNQDALKLIKAISTIDSTKVKLNYPCSPEFCFNLIYPAQNFIINTYIKNSPRIQLTTFLATSLNSCYFFFPNKLNWTETNEQLGSLLISLYQR